MILSAGTTQAFTEEAVNEEDLTTILAAGVAAASAINQQPWYFVALTSKDVMDELGGGMGFGGAPAGMPAVCNRMPEGMTPPEGMALPEGMTPPEGMAAPGGAMPSALGGGSSAKAGMGDSPLAIIIYMNENTASPDPAFDCGLACQNMVIAANALGYGTKIVSSPTMTLNGANHDALCEKLGVDPALKAVAVLLVGKTNLDATTSPSVRNAPEEKVSFIK